jgi:membrane protein YqaA with SNARE-associated domain
MPLDNEDAGLRRVRARFSSLGIPALVELTAIVVLVVGLLWLTRTYSRIGDFVRTLLNLRLWLLVLLVSGFGTAGNLGPYYLGKRGVQEVFARFPRLEGERWARVETAFQQRGASLLVLAGTPTFGLVLTAAAGALGIERNAFLRWVMLSKVIRNWLIVFVSYLGLQLVSGTPLA